MRKITVLVSLALLSCALNIAALTGKRGDSGSANRAPARRAQPARLPLASDSEKTDAERLIVPAASVAVSVDATTTVRTVDSRISGINAAVWDSTFESRTTITHLESIGARLLRFPGGSLSDEYHWKTNTTLANTWTWATSFDDFASIATTVGSDAIITVNYGTGTADEAASWVEYSNITKGYGFKYWEIGNENYGTWETDSHAVKNDPYTYANEAKNYITRMKAADPTIKVGVVVTTGEDSYTNNRNHPATNPRTGAVHNGWTPVLLETLESLNTFPDFAIYHRYEQNPPNESDAGLLQSAATWKNDAADLRRQLTDYLGSAGNNIEIVCTENNSVSFDPGKQSTSLVNGLFLADTVGSILQTEFNMFVWWDMGNGYVLGKNNSPGLYGWRNYGDYGITSVDDETYPTYHVYKLLSHFAAAGDTVIDARSQSALLAAYATKRVDGRLSLMLINKSPDQEITAQIGVAGFTPSSSAVVYAYGKPQDEAARTLNGSPDITQTVFTSASNSFDYTMAPYSVAVISLLPSVDDFELAATPSGAAINAGGEAIFNLRAAFANGFSQPVSITAQVDEPAAFNLSIVQPDVTSSQPARLVVGAKQGIPAEAHSILVTASGGGLERTGRITVTLLDPPVISSAFFAGKLLTVTATGLGELPRVFVNGVDRTEMIKRIQGSQITIKGKKKKLGLVDGENRIQVTRGQAAGEFIFRL
jgi:hypothetical protein